MIIDADVSGEGSVPTGCNVGPNDTTDNDKDGWSAADGDCNDCDALVNPGAFDDGSPTADGGAPVDTNCDGQPGGDTYECDDGLQIADNDAFNAAKAIGLCKKADANATGKDKTWGVIDARFVKADGTAGMNPLSHGILPQFGQNGNVQGRQDDACVVIGYGPRPGDGRLSVAGWRADGHELQSADPEHGHSGLSGGRDGRAQRPGGA